MIKPLHVTRWLRWILWILAGFILLIALAWFGLIFYARAHRQEILAKITDALGKQVQGEIRIRNLDPSIFRSFPNLTIVLYDVSLRDSLWHVHKHSLFEAKELEVRIDAIGLLKKKTDIQMIKALHASMFFYVDSTGYSNTYLLSKKDTSSDKNKKPAIIRAFALEDTHFWFVNKVKEKFFHFEIKSLSGLMSEVSDVLSIHLNGSALVHEMNFNVRRGSYLHNQTLGLNLVLRMHRNEKRLEIEDQTVRISGTPITIGGNFYLDRKPAAFELRFHSPSVKYKTAIAWVSPNISSKLNNFDFDQPIALEARVSGIMQFRAVPLVQLKYQIRDNTLHAKFGDVKNLSYDGTFSNEIIPELGHTDQNSRLSMIGVKANFNELPFQCDTVIIDNLIRPYVKAHIVSKFPAKELNNQIDESVASFKDGSVDIDVNYMGGILAIDTMPRQLNGYVQIKDISLKYVPRNLDLQQARATLMFRGEDLFIRDVHAKLGQSNLNMEGEALRFLRFYFADPGKVAINWKIRSNYVNVADFLNFTASRKSGQPGRKIRKTVSSIGRQLGVVMDQSTVHLDTRIDKLIFKKFSAETVIAVLDLTPGRLELDQLKIVDGTSVLNMSGRIVQGTDANPFTLNCTIRDADLPKLFRSFDNFGQDGITAENLKGKIQADINLSGFLNNGQVIRNSMKGTIQFEWQDGALVHFEPLEKVGKFVFKKRNLSNLEIRELTGRFTVDGEKIKIPQMSISTSALNMNVQGVYGLKGGTDIFLEIPLRNPDRKEATTGIAKFLMKSTTVHLRLTNESGENLKVAWDPTKKGEKATAEKLNE
jgi:hypothetical protein